MDAVRTLPIRLTPVAGEALDSWLEGLARRTHSAFGDVLSAVGLDPHRGKGSSSWIVKLTDEEAERIGLATGVEVEVLESMTLAHYSERGLRIKDGTFGAESGLSLGACTCGSRFCPSCLKDNRGKMAVVVAARLGIRVHEAPLFARRCLSRVRSRPTSPHPRRRPHPKSRRMRPHPHECDRTQLLLGVVPTSLRRSVTVFDADHPVVHAQRVVECRNRRRDCVLRRLPDQPAATHQRLVRPPSRRRPGAGLCHASRNCKLSFPMICVLLTSTRRGIRSADLGSQARIRNRGWLHQHGLLPPPSG